jgi:hypothetical protein
MMSRLNSGNACDIFCPAVWHLKNEVSKLFCLLFLWVWLLILAFREEHMLRVFEHMVLRTYLDIGGRKWQEAWGNGILRVIIYTFHQMLLGWWYHMGKECSMYGAEVSVGDWRNDTFLKSRRMILKWVVEKYGRSVWTGCISFRHWWQDHVNTTTDSWVPRNVGSWLPEWLLASVFLYLLWNGCHSLYVELCIAIHTFVTTPLASQIWFIWFRFAI